MKKRMIMIIAVFLCVLLLVVGVPVIINECYKTGGYITLWNAADVLTYYGTILGAIVSVAVLAGTIRFTRKQILHDQYVKGQSEKWQKVDTILTQAINAIEPIQITQILYADVGYEHVGETINQVQRYMINAKMSLDALKCYIDSTEEARVGTLIQQILLCINEVEPLNNQMVQQLSFIRNNKMYDNYKKCLRLALQSPGIVDEQTIQRCRDYLKENPYIPPDDILKEIGEIGLKLMNVHNTKYQELLVKKRETFREIERKNAEQANKMLSWFSGRGQ